MMGFAEKLKIGLTSEQMVAKYYASKGWAVFPTFNMMPDGRGPRVIKNGVEYIAPDVQIVKDRVVKWVEVKTCSYTAFNINGKFESVSLWIKQLDEYKKFNDDIGDVLICLVMLGERNTTSGIYCEDIKTMIALIDHIWEPDGKVYWKLGNLNRIADI